MGLGCLVLVLLLVLAHQVHAACQQRASDLGADFPPASTRGRRAAKGRERKKDQKYGGSRTKGDDAQALTGLVCSDEEDAVLRDEDDEYNL